VGKRGPQHPQHAAAEGSCRGGNTEAIGIASGLIGTLSVVFVIPLLSQCALSVCDLLCFYTTDNSVLALAAFKLIVVLSPSAI